MRSDYNKILIQLETDLELLKSGTENILIQAEEGIKITKQALMRMREIVIRNKFQSEASEVHFFKFTKPQVYSKLIYFVKLFNIESKRPRSSNKSQIKYFNRQIDKLQDYFNENIEFYQYYRSNKSSFDEHYFLRGKMNIRLHPDTFHFFTDQEFSTSHDSTVATIMAYDLLIIYFKREIDKIENNEPFGTDTLGKSFIRWTGNKVDLIELIYALYASNSINKGDAEIKDIARIAERIFKIDLGNYYHAFMEIKARKINQSKYLDKLKEAFLDYVKKSDE